MAHSIEILGERYAEILTPQALAFLEGLVRELGPGLTGLLQAREAQAREVAGGQSLDFLEHTRAIREGAWTVAPAPTDLLDRRVEITGPTDRKMVINAMNCGANCFMADLEDSTAPTWANVMQGQINLRDAVGRTIQVTDQARGRHYVLGEDTATLLVRPRGLHLPEAHLRLDGVPLPAALVDFGLYFFHNAPALIGQGSGPYFYLPKLESHLEARWWNQVFVLAQRTLGVPRGTVRATVLIETLPAAFEMDEILYELREHASGLNCGRWDYIFSFIKTLRHDPEATLPNRGQVGMEQPNMRAYTRLAVQTCHRRGAHAMGGMAAQIPIKRDPAANEVALSRVRADKEREVQDGHDGTWVAHPGLVHLAREVFDAGMRGPNQVHRRLEDLNVTARDLLEIPRGTCTEAGVRTNIRVGVQYLEAWLDGRGCVPLYDLMEDAATAEISRAQLWQWIHHGVALADGSVLTRERFTALLSTELDDLRDELGSRRFSEGRFDRAVRMFSDLCTAEHLDNFLTTVAYPHLQSLNTERAAT
jgi:malate synthase